jgi:hypothetical protein
MLDEYKLNGKTVKVEAELEADIADKLSLMSQYMGFGASEIINTALKRFVAVHSDFMPPAGTLTPKKLK